MKTTLPTRCGGFRGGRPLCSFVYITVNGEEWGLYLAVEGVEEAFLERNCGSDYGELYKPDSVSMGGGRGNGAGFDMDDWQQVQEQQAEDSEDLPEGFSPEEGAFPGGGMPFPGGMPGPTGEESQSDGTESETDSNSRDIPEDMGFPGGGEPPEGMTIPEGMEPPENMELPDGTELSSCKWSGRRDLTRYSDPESYRSRSPARCAQGERRTGRCQEPPSTPPCPTGNPRTGSPGFPVCPDDRIPRPPGVCSRRGSRCRMSPRRLRRNPQSTCPDRPAGILELVA